MFRPTLFTLALIAATPALAQTAEKTMPRAEMVKNAEGEFARVDANKDGQMSRTEIETFQRAATMRMITERNQSIFTALDLDKNGQLSAVEFAKLSNTSPKIDISNVMRVDTNKDGQVSLAEHRTATLSTFTRFDTNKDGILTAAEVQANAAKN